MKAGNQAGKRKTKKKDKLLFMFFSCVSFILDTLVLTEYIMLQYIFHITIDVKELGRKSRHTSMNSPHSSQPVAIPTL